MKQLILPAVIIVGLLTFFFIIDRKDFDRVDDAESVQTDSSVSPNRKTAPAFIPEQKPIAEVSVPPENKSDATENETEIKQGSNEVFDKKPAGIAGSDEMQLVDLQPAMHQTDVSGGDRSTIPSAVPVLAPEEAEQANAVALNAYEAQTKAMEEVESQRREKAAIINGSKDELGYRLVLKESFNSYASVPLSQEQEKIIAEKGYDLSEFKQRSIPKQFALDISDLPENAIFKKVVEGFEIESNEGRIRFDAPIYDSMAKSFLFELTVSDSSAEDDCVISLGMHYSGLAKSGYLPLRKATLHPGETQTLLGSTDVYDLSAFVIPAITVKGAATIKEFSIYQKDHEEFTVLEGEITERSALPPPEETDYPNCRFTAHFAGNAILSGQPCDKELSLSIDGFRNKEILGTNKLEPGDKIRCAIIPMEQAPEELTSIQEADDLSLFTLDSFLVTSLSSIASYQDIPSSEQIGFKSEVLNYKSVFDEGINEKIPDYLVKAQKERIERDLIAATEMLNDFEKNRNDIEKRFQDAWTKEKGRFPDGYNTIDGRFVWRNVDHSFWSLPKNHIFVPEELKTLPQSRLDALVALKDFLELNGIQLIISFIPNWYDISARIINRDFIDIPDYQSAMYVKQLSEAGIECPYFAEAIIRNYDKYPLSYLFPKDPHPGSGVQFSVAEVISDRLREYQFPRPLDPGKISCKQVITYGGLRPIHVWPANCDIDDNDPGAFYTADQILYDGQPVSPDKNSEILIVGNSSIEFPMYTPDALQAFFAERLCYRVDNIRVNSSGPFTTLIQRFFDNSAFYLKGKKVIVLQTLDSILSDDESIPWNNIRQMDQQRMILSGKKLVTSLSVKGNGNWGDEIHNEVLRKQWDNLAGKQEIKCLDDEEFEIVNQTLDHIDLSKPVLCVVQTVRSTAYKTPKCIVNGQAQDVPAIHSGATLSWQNMYFELPAGTDKVQISVKGPSGTLMGFKQILIYQ